VLNPVLCSGALFHLPGFPQVRVVFDRIVRLLCRLYTQKGWVALSGGGCESYKVSSWPLSKPLWAPV
jgi:hypothetical protein